MATAVDSSGQDVAGKLQLKLGRATAPQVLAGCEVGSTSDELRCSELDALARDETLRMRLGPSLLMHLDELLD